MIGWILLAILVGLITLIMLIPIGADLRYEDEVIRVSAKVAGIKIQLIPKKRKSQKRSSQRRKSQNPNRSRRKKSPKRRKRDDRSH